MPLPLAVYAIDSQRNDTQCVRITMLAVNCLLLSQADRGIDVIVENLANVNIDKDLELAGLNCRIVVSKLVCYLCYHVSCLYLLCVDLTAKSALQNDCS